MTNERKEKLEKVISYRQPGLGVVLENVFDPHNISAVMRSCDAVGIQDLYILNTKIPRHEKWGFKSSSSAAKWLSVQQFDNAADCFAILRSRYDAIVTTHLSSDAVNLYDMDLTGNIALVFGNEHAGVSEEIRALADGNFIIPQVGIIQSLNISVACAVSIYEAYRQRNKAGLYSGESNTSYHGRLRQLWELEI
ncbi:MAG: RNA methyltransferase [Niabella sp.]|nr:RNA methyltransferase [Niabella sp.]